MNLRFNKWSGFYSKFVSMVIGSLPDRAFNYFIENFDLPSNDEKILDLGCGNGIFTSKLLKSRKNVIGLDLKTGYTKLAAERIKEHVILGNGCELPLKNNCLERVLLIHVLHHVDEQTQQIIVKECKRVLKTNGKIIIFEHLLPNGIKGVFLNSFWKLLDSGKKYNELSEWVDLFEKNGFKFKIKTFDLEGHKFRNWFRIFELEIQKQKL